jgi:hypothetical protein
VSACVGRWLSGLLTLLLLGLVTPAWAQAAQTTEAFVVLSGRADVPEGDQVGDLVVFHGRAPMSLSRSALPPSSRWWPSQLLRRQTTGDLRRLKHRLEARSVGGFPPEENAPP